MRGRAVPAWVLVKEFSLSLRYHNKIDSKQHGFGFFLRSLIQVTIIGVDSNSHGFFTIVT